MARRQAAFPDRYLPGWGLASAKDLLFIRLIQSCWRSVSSRAHRKKRKQRSQPSRRPLKPAQEMKMHDLSSLPTRRVHNQKEKPDITSERPMLRSAHDIFSDPALTNHKRWTRTVADTDRDKQIGTLRSSKAATGPNRPRTHATAGHRVEQTTTRPSLASPSVQRQPQSARADFSATKARACQNPHPPRASTRRCGAPPSPASGRRIKQRENRSTTTIPNQDLSTFGGIQQRGGRLGSSNEPIANPTRQDEQDRGEYPSQAKIATWWLEEKARARWHLQTVRDGDKPAWDLSTALAC